MEDIDVENDTKTWSQKDLKTQAIDPKVDSWFSKALPEDDECSWIPPLSIDQSKDTLLSAKDDDDRNAVSKHSKSLPNNDDTFIQKKTLWLSPKNWLTKKNTYDKNSVDDELTDMDGCKDFDMSSVIKPQIKQTQTLRSSYSLSILENTNQKNKLSSTKTARMKEIRRVTSSNIVSKMIKRANSCEHERVYSKHNRFLSQQNPSRSSVASIGQKYEAWFSRSHFSLNKVSPKTPRDDEMCSHTYDDDSSDTNSSDSCVEGDKSSPTPNNKDIHMESLNEAKKFSFQNIEPLEPVTVSQSNAKNKWQRARNAVFSMKLKPKPEHIDDTAHQDSKRMRLRILEEFVSSEQTYVNSLELLVHVFVMPLRDSDIKIDARVLLLLNNAEHIFTVNTTFLHQMTQRLTLWKNSEYDSSSLTITDVINDNVPLFSFYERYSTNMHTTMTILQSNEKNHIILQKKLAELVLDERLKGETLESLLIKPVQRIPRYILLVQEMRKHTQKENPDSLALLSTIGNLQRIAENLNREIRSQDDRKGLVKLQQIVGKKIDVFASRRRLIRSGTLHKINRHGDRKKLHMYLFNDVLIITRVSKIGFKVKIDSLETLTVDVAGAGLEDFRNCFRIQTPQKSFLVCAESDKEESIWFAELNKIIDQYSNQQYQGDLNIDVNDNSSEVEQSKKNIVAAPMWTPYSKQPTCFLCQAEFSLLLRRHHCRQCGSVVCGSCSPNRRILLFIDNKKKQRICSKCENDDETMNEKNTNENVSPKSFTHDTKDSSTPRTKSIAFRSSRSLSSSDFSSRTPSKTLHNRYSSFASQSRTHSHIVPDSMFINTIDSSITSSTTSMTELDTKRDATAEIVRSEAKFSDELKITLQVIVRPLLQRLIAINSRSIDPDMASAFDILEQMLTLSRKTSSDLNLLLQDWQEDSVVGDVFVRKASLYFLFEQYAGYVNPARKALASTDLVEWLSEYETNKRLGGLGLDRRLLLPLKRLKIYTFMLNNVLKLTETHSNDYNALQKAISIMKECSMNVVAAMKKGSSREKLVELELELRGKVQLVSPGRIFIRFGKVHLFVGEVSTQNAVPKLSKRRIYLFSDRIIVTKKNAIGALKIEHDIYLCKLQNLRTDSMAEQIFQQNETMASDHAHQSFVSVMRLINVADNLCVCSLLVREQSVTRSWFRDVDKFIGLSRQIGRMNDGTMVEEPMNSVESDV